MNKLKHKQPPKNFFRYFLDEYILFRRDIVIETPASVEDCVTQLGELRYEKQDWSEPSRIVSSFTEKSDSVQFKITVEHGPKRAYSRSATAEGSIANGGSTTFISGTVVLSGSFNWIFISILSLLILIPLVDTDLIRSEPISLLLLLPLYGAGLMYMWLPMYRDRNYLMQCIQSAINLAEMSASRKKDEQITQPYDDDSEPQSQQSKT